MPAFGRTDAQKKQHRERSQPFNRQRYGLLEKKKDYVLRAQDYKQKQTRLKTLRNKAAQKNEDEFYFGMVHQRTKKGVATKSRGNEALSQDITKVLKTQDAAYIQTITAIERQKVAQLVHGQHLKPSERQHQVFVETLDDLDAEPREVAVRDQSKEERSIRRRNAHAKGVAAREILARQARLEKLHVLGKEVQLHRNLQSKGPRKLVGRDEDGTPRYKWKRERKR